MVTRTTYWSPPVALAAELEPALALVERVLDQRRITPAFQPLVHLASGEVVGFEALARGPEGTAAHTPGALFGLAEQLGRVGELDWVCRAVALEQALASGLDPSFSWFLNVEPSGLATPCPEDLSPPLAAARRLRVVLEMTEREVDRDPARLLRATAAARRSRWGVAVDDVGAAPRSLALLPFVQPDVVKLDMSLVHSLDHAGTAAVANAVRAYAERTGAVILAEGIETEADEMRARVLGASYGQGWRYGRPGPLPRSLAAPQHPFCFGQVLDPDTGRTPFEIGAGSRPVGRASKDLLVPMSLHLERQALAGGEALVLLASFQQARHLTAGTRARYAELAHRNVLTVAMAAGLDAVAGADGVRAVDLAAGDPLLAEWNVIVVGPHFAGALLARDLGDRSEDRQRRFDYLITHDRELVIRAARAMLRRITEP